MQQQDSRKLEKPYPKREEEPFCFDTRKTRRGSKKKKTYTHSIEIRTRVSTPSRNIEESLDVPHRARFPSLLWNVVEEPFDYLARHVDADLTSVALTSESKEPSACSRPSRVYTRPLIPSVRFQFVHCTQNTIHDKFDEHGWRAIYRVCIAKRC